MSQTKAGAAKAAITNKQRHGEDFYKRLGALGGMKSRNGGFASRVECHCELISGAHLIRNCAGRRGGLHSRRPKKVTL